MRPGCHAQGREHQIRGFPHLRQDGVVKRKAILRNVVFRSVIFLFLLLTVEKKESSL
jgi:hypothetical protein